MHILRRETLSADDHTAAGGRQGETYIDQDGRVAARVRDPHLGVGQLEWSQGGGRQATHAVGIAGLQELQGRGVIRSDRVVPLPGRFLAHVLVHGRGRIRRIHDIVVARVGHDLSVEGGEVIVGTISGIAGPGHLHTKMLKTFSVCNYRASIVYIQ